jgi:hypothetical protein
MAYDPIGERLLISDNTADGRLYAVSKTGVQEELPLAIGLAGIASVAVSGAGEIFVSTAPFGSPGAVLQVDRTTGATTEVLGGLELGAGLAFHGDDLIVQDAYFDAQSQLRGRLRMLGQTQPLLDNMQSSYSVAVDSEGDIFTTGNGGLFSVAGSPLAETSLLPSQFSTAIAFDPGTLPFEGFSGPDGGRLAFAAEAAFGMEDQFVTLLTPARPGDYHGDGNVDSADYSTWQSEFGSSSKLAADGNLDGVVSAADYVVWRKIQIVGNTSSFADGPKGVPEPGTWPCALALAAAFLSHCRPQRAIP